MRCLWARVGPTSRSGRSRAARHNGDVPHQVPKVLERFADDVLAHRRRREDEGIAIGDHRPVRAGERVCAAEILQNIVVWQRRAEYRRGCAILSHVLNGPTIDLDLEGSEPIHNGLRQGSQLRYGEIHVRLRAQKIVGLPGNDDDVQRLASGHSEVTLLRGGGRALQNPEVLWLSDRELVLVSEKE